VIEQQHACAELSSDRRAVQARGAGADDDGVEAGTVVTQRSALPRGTKREPAVNGRARS